MPKSAFKLKAIHLHIFDYSINLPPVFFFFFSSPTNQQLRHAVELFIVDDDAADGGMAVGMCEYCTCVEQRWNLKRGKR